MLLSADPVLSADHHVDEADILAKIRSKLADARIQRSYWLGSQVFRRRGDGKLCRGCDRPILRTDRTSVGYMSIKGERHWFHLLCDTVRQFVAVNEMKREYKTRGSEKRFRSTHGVNVLSRIGTAPEFRDELVDGARAT